MSLDKCKKENNGDYDYAGVDIGFTKKIGNWAK